MTQQTIDLPIDLSGETVSEDLKSAMQRAGDTDQPDIFFFNEAAWNPPKEASRGCHNTGIHHVGLRAANPAASAEFYRDVLGMRIVGGSAPDHPIGATAFLSSRPDEESHEIALFANPAFAHVAFKVSSLAELRSFYARVVERNTPIKFLANHGVSFAFYFDDPDGNMIEVYWPTGELSRSLQPQMEPLDLSQPDEALLEKILAKHPQSGAPAGGANGTASQRSQFKYVPAGTGPAYWGPGDRGTLTSPSRSLHSPSCDPSTPVSWKGISRSSSWPTTVWPFAFYFDDPDGNMIEVYWPTGELSRSLQPQMEPLDLSQPDEALLEKILAKHPQSGAPA